MKGITNENDLFNLANRLSLHIDDINTLDDIRNFKPSGAYILLLRKVSSIGHWVAYNNGEYFDSFGEPPPKKLSHYVKKYNHKQFQSVDQNYCGWWCLLFLYSVQKNRPDLLNQMINVSF